VPTSLHGFYLGSIVGHALGLPVNKRPHHIIRMYFKGIKGYTDEYYSAATPTGLRKGQTAISVREPLAESLRQPSARESMACWVRRFIAETPDEQTRLTQFFEHLHTGAAIVDALRQSNTAPEEQKKITDAVQLFPSDMVQEFDEAMTEKNAVMFALAMLHRNADDFETTVLSTINMGGLAATTGSIVGAAIGIMHSETAIPHDWINGLDDYPSIAAALGME
jgi:ADP-ribosylglycohydrolase